MSTSKYEKIANLSESQFQRLTGVNKFLFELMVLVIEDGQKKARKKAGRPSNLGVADQVLMLLEYYREYRTFFHLGVDYGLNESNVQRNIEKNEAILMASGYFRLDGKKVLASSKNIKNIRIDVTECNVQRPKKK